MKLQLRIPFSIIAISILAHSVYSSIESAPCNTTAQCQKIYTKIYECESNICLREDFKYNIWEILGFAGITTISTITSSGGVGAGIVIVPAFTLFFGFVSSDSVHLSRVSILMSAFVSFCINWRKKDPLDTSKLVINYHIAGILLPFHLAGAEVGVLIGRFLPSVAVVGILFILLIVSIDRTYKRGKEEIKRESAKSTLNQENASAALSASMQPEPSSLPVEMNGNPGIDPNLMVHLDTAKPSFNSGSLPELTNQKISLFELVSQYSFSLFICFASLLLIILSALVRGGHSKPSIAGLESCTKTTAIILIITQILVCALGFVAYHHDREFVEKDVKPMGLFESMTRLHPGYSLFLAGYLTGVTAGIVGVGGGLLLMIYLISIGEDIHMSSAVTLFLVMFSSGSTMVQSIMVGGIHPRHAYPMMAASLCGALLGNFVVKPTIQRTGKSSIILWILMVVLILAVLVLPVDTTIGIINSPDSSLDIGKFC